MTPQQFYGWYRDHDFLHESKMPRRDTWLAKKLNIDVYANDRAMAMTLASIGRFELKKISCERELP